MIFHLRTPVGHMFRVFALDMTCVITIELLFETRRVSIESDGTF